MSLLGPSSLVGNAAQLAKVNAAGSTTQASGNKAGPPGSSFLGTYGMNRGPTSLLKEAQGQTALGFDQRTEEGMTSEENQLQPLTYRHWARFAQASWAAQAFKGMLMFVHDSEAALAADVMASMTYPLCALNFELERSARDNALAQLAAGQIGGPTPVASWDGKRALDGRSKSQQNAYVDAISPQHVREYVPNERGKRHQGVFTQFWRYAGGMHHIDIESRPNQTILMMAAQQHLTMPNLWGALEIGSKVGFMLRWVGNGFHTKHYDSDGTVIGQPPNVPYLQLVPYSREAGYLPPNLSAKKAGDAPLPTDLDSLVPCVVRQEVNLTDAYGRPTSALSSRPEHEALRFAYQRYDFGQPFYVGFVTRVAETPSAELCRRALRSPEDYMTLCSARYAIDVQLGVYI